jgi:phosphoglycerate dehydrogenase-like enzyme
LYHKRVGVIGASMVGRALIKLLKPFGPDIMVYDPYLSDERAAGLGVRRVDLDELMSTADVITNHAPTTEETEGMVTSRHWSSVKDGALFVNTARAAAVDYDALLRELQTGRITAALDVFPLPEPLAEESPFRKLPNVILSPHAAGLTAESLLRIGETVADEFVRFFAGQPLRYGVTADMLRTMA